MKLVLSSLQLFFDVCGISGLKIKGRPNETKFARGLSLRPTFIILNPYESPWTLDVHWFDHFSLWSLGPQKGLQGLNLVWDISEQRSTGLIFSKTIWVETLGSLICTLLVINFNQRAPRGLTNFAINSLVEHGQPGHKASLLQSSPLKDLHQSSHTGLSAMLSGDKSSSFSLHSFWLVDLGHLVGIPCWAGVFQHWPNKCIVGMPLCCFRTATEVSSKQVQVALCLGDGLVCVLCEA